MSFRAQKQHSKPGSPMGLSAWCVRARGFAYAIATSTAIRPENGNLPEVDI